MGTDEATSGKNRLRRGQVRRRSGGGSAPLGAVPSSSATRSDVTDLADLANRVLVALTPLQVYGLIVAARRGGIVVLDGATRTEADRAAADHLAAVPGATRVLNRLVVDPLVGSMPVERTVLSPELAAEIVENHRDVESGTEFDLNATIGTTSTAEATDEAEPYFPPTDPPVRRAPREVEGIEVVGSFAGTSLEAPIDLEQLPRSLLTGDDAIARQVRLALAEDAATADLPIHVTVRNGIVHLRGVVPSLVDAELAEEVAWRVPNVRDVQEELEVVNV